MRAWSLIALGDDRQYGGNIGYRDDPQHTYRYDSNVPNSRQVKAGDLIFIRDRKFLIGLAIIEAVTSELAAKVRRRCPSCNSVNIKERHAKLPPWRCVNGHEFEKPRIENVRVTAFEADYGGTYRVAPRGISVTQLKSAALRPNDQLAIEEVDPSQLEKLLVAKSPELFSLFVAAAQGTRPQPDDALDGDSEGQHLDMSASDTRKFVLRSIKQRRGQRKFRKDLSRRYGPICMVSGCTLFDIIEAAHIWPHQGEASNNLKNGLLLRADLHTLFDLDLLGIHPDTLVINFHPDALSAGYAGLAGKKLGSTEKHRPARNALEERWSSFVKRMGNPDSE